MRSRTCIRICIVLSLAAGGAACSKKPPASLPPPLSSSEEGTERSAVDSSLDALRQDFLARAGSDTVYFATDSSLLDQESKTRLEAQAAWLVAHPQLVVSVEGHCDERGTREYNLALGDRRALAAKNYLAARGVDPSRLRTVSWGKERPLAMGSDEASWAQNRRAVTLLVSFQ